MENQEHRVPLASIWIPESLERQRKNVDETKVKTLADSIAEVGLINAITVEPPDKQGRYRLIAGERRFHALKKLKWTEAPVRIMHSDNELMHRCRELAENVERLNLSWQEETQAIEEIHQLMQQRKGESAGGSRTGKVIGHRQQDTADMLGVSRPTIGFNLKLAEELKAFPEALKQPTAKDAIKYVKSRKAEVINAELAKRAEQESNTPLSRARQKLMNSYIVSDSFKGLASMDAGVADVIELDPPYAIGFENQTRAQDKSLSAAADGGFKDLSDKEFIGFMEQAVAESLRVLKPNGWLLCWFSMHPWHCKLYELLSKHLHIGMTPMIWDKVHKCGRVANPHTHLTVDYEPCFYARRGEAQLRKPGASSMMRHKPGDNKVHPTEKPMELYIDMLSKFVSSGMLVVSPFLGSGNVIMAAEELGCRCVGFDSNQRYKDAFVARLSEWEPPVAEFKI